MQGSDTPDKDERAVGSVGMNLEVAEGIDLEQVSYSINTGLGAPINGTIPVTADATPIEKLITGVPAGTAEVALRGVGRDGAVCEGFGRTYVRGGKVSLLAILLQCLLKGHRGNIDMKGKFNICPEAELASCALAQATIGAPFALTASGNDPDGDRLAYHWSSSAGSFSNARAQSTVFTCEDPGTQTIEFSVDDGRGCADTQEFTIFCSKGARPVCGNGQIEAGEACDDGNRRAGDGCSPTCTLEEEPDDSVLCPSEGGGILTGCTCENCSTQVAAAETDPGAALAIDLLECMRTNSCHGRECLCAEQGDAACTMAPAGPCSDEVLAAAATNDPAVALMRLNNTAFPVGRAMAVDACSIEECGECL